MHTVKLAYQSQEAKRSPDNQQDFASKPHSSVPTSHKSPQRSKSQNSGLTKLLYLLQGSEDLTSRVCFCQPFAVSVGQYFGLFFLKVEHLRLVQGLQTPSR